MSEMDSTTAPAQELVEHNTRISAVALSARLKAAEADLEALRELGRAAVVWIDEQDREAAGLSTVDAVIHATDELDRLIRALPLALRLRLLSR